MNLYITSSGWWHWNSFGCMTFHLPELKSRCSNLHTQLFRRFLHSQGFLDFSHFAPWWCRRWHARQAWTPHHHQYTHRGLWWWCRWWSTLFSYDSVPSSIWCCKAAAFILIPYLQFASSGKIKVSMDGRGEHTSRLWSILTTKMCAGAISLLEACSWPSPCIRLLWWWWKP
jgi:hypothetical protein